LKLPPVTNSWSEGNCLPPRPGAAGLTPPQRHGQNRRRIIEKDCPPDAERQKTRQTANPKNSDLTKQRLPIVFVWLLGRKWKYAQNQEKKEKYGFTTIARTN
jgi:hypothetical protein